MVTSTYEGLLCGKCGGTERYIKGNRCAPCRRQQCRKWAEKNKKYIEGRSSARYHSNKEKARQENSAWQRKNAAKLAEKARIRFKKDPEKVLAINRKWWDNNRDKANEAQRKSQRKNQLKQYGLTESDYSDILESQGGGCAICRRSPLPEEKSFAVDHCHATGKIRGILCGSCNRGLGLFRDDVFQLKEAIIYLECAPLCYEGKK
jgi:hypothetical protein